MDVTAAIKWLNAAVINNVGHPLREPEIVILKGTWRGLTYEQMSNGSEYSTNYLMRDVAPKLWKQLSHVFGGSVGKTNFRVALEAYVLAHAESEPTLATYGLVESGFPAVLAPDSPNMAASDAGLFWHPAVASDPRNAVSATTASYVLSTDGGYGDGFSTMPVPPTLYGYADELLQAKQWLSAAALGARPGTWESTSDESERSGGGHCRLVGIWGIGGVGKTLLAKTLVSQVGEQFDGVIWRSLKDRPTLNDLCCSILMGLGVMPASSQATVQLLSLLSQKSILLVLDGMESILQSGRLAGEYQAGYETYDEFFQSAAGLRGCIVVTGIEGPSSLRCQRGYMGDDSAGVQSAGVQSAGVQSAGVQSVGALTLGELSEPAAIALLQAESLKEADCWPALIARYQGHPLALKSAARIIRDIFDSQVAAFLAQTSVLFTDISRLLAPSFQRLSAAEKSILYWLASQEAPLSLAALQRSLPLSMGVSELVSTLDSLKQRSLLAVQSGSVVQRRAGQGSQRQEGAVQLAGRIKENPLPVPSYLAEASALPKFYLASLVKAYAIQQLMAQFSEQGPSIHPETFAFERGVVASSRGEYPQGPHQVAALEPILNLSAGEIAPIPLNQWREGQFGPNWQALDRLFALSAHPEIRLRNVYHWREADCVKRCKAIAITKQNSQDLIKEIFLLMAVYQEGENLYKVCVQAQPTQAASVLPRSLTMGLLDALGTRLASIMAQQDDTFIQLPCFRGARSEGFDIEITLGEHHHTERFVI